MSRRQLYLANIANTATHYKLRPLRGVFIFYTSHTSVYVIHGVCVRGIKHPCPKGVNTAGNPGELADYKLRETADSRQATARTRTGLHALDAEPCRRADQDGRTSHGARTRGRHPFEGFAGPSSEGARGSHRRGRRELSRHVFWAARNRGIRPKLDAKPPVFAEIVRKRRMPGHSKAEIFELTGPRHDAEGSTGEPNHE